MNQKKGKRKKKKGESEREKEEFEMWEELRREEEREEMGGRKN